MVISAVTAPVARGFTILPGLLGKIGARLHLGRPRYLFPTLRDNHERTYRNCQQRENARRALMRRNSNEPLESELR